MEQISFGSTSVILRVFIPDSSSSTGAGLTGLDHSSSGLKIATIANANESSPTVYSVAGSTIETISTIGTYAAPTATKCRFKAVDGTNMPGWYEIHLANARFSVSGSSALDICISGATNAVQVNKRVQLNYVVPNNDGLSEIDAKIGAFDTGSDTIKTGLTAISAQTSLITSGDLTILSPYGNGTLTLKRGDTYSEAAGQTIEISEPSGASWPDLTDGWTVTLHCRIRNPARLAELPDGDVAVLQKAITVVNATTVRIDTLTASDTEDLMVGNNIWDFEIEATKSGMVNTLVSGAMTVVAEISGS